MSNRVAGTSDEALAAWIKDVERRLENLSTGGLRGPNSSFGLPFQIGNYRFFDHNGELCVLNLVTNEIQCMTGGGDCVLRVNRYFTPGTIYPLDIPGGTQVMEFYVLGAGGGGGGGARPDTGDRASGGGGGGNGCCMYTKLTIEQFLVMIGEFSPYVVVGAGGVGGDGGFAAGAVGIAADNGGISAVVLVAGEGLNGIIGAGGGGGGGGQINDDADGGIACGPFNADDGGGNMDLTVAGTVTGGYSFASFDDNIGGANGRRGFCSGGGGGGGGTTSGDVATAGGAAEGNNGVTRYYMVGNGYGGNGGIAGVSVPVIGGRGSGGGGGAAGTVADLFGQHGATGGDGEVVVIFYGGCGAGGSSGALGDAGGNVGGGGVGDGDGGPGGGGGGGGGGDPGGGGGGAGGGGGPAGDGLVRVGIDWTQDRPPVGGYDTLQQTYKIHNHHIACFGMNNAATFISPGVYNWSTLDSCVASMEAAAGPGAQLMITFCEAPPWATDGGLECDGTTVEFPNAANYANFAQLCADVADRYPQVLYFQFWNEMKGLFDGGLGRWRYEDYTTLYNLIEAAVHGVRPDALLGGPYPVFSSGDGSMSNPSALTFAGGSVDQRDLDVMTYFAANANDGGGDFIAIDLFAGNIRGGPTIATGQSNTSMMEDKFIKSLQWVRANISASKLIVVSETYVNAGGYTQDQAGTALINMMVRVEAEVTVGNGIWFMLWHEQDEFPQVYFYGDGSEYAFADQLRAWQP